MLYKLNRSLQFAANLSMLYPEREFLDRFQAAAHDGFKAVEFMFAYDWPAQDIAQAAQDAGVEVVLLNAPPGGQNQRSISQAWGHGLRGTACLPGHEAEFQNGVLLALEYAQALNCPRVHVLAGVVPLEHQVPSALPLALQTSHAYASTPGPLRDTYLRNLRWAAEQAAAAGKTILIEPINGRDIPHYFLNKQEDAHAIVQDVGAANLQVQFDLYHCQIVEGDVLNKLRHYLPTGRVGHVQIAGVPLRHEPDISELHYPSVFDCLNELQWQGWIGCEYRPSRGTTPGGTTAGLGWRPR
jgi:hydroxypyruvate isomerase